MYDFFLGKWGLDWAAAIFMFISIYRLGEHKRDGFIHAALASLFWILFNIKVESAAGIVANAIILGMSIRSFRRASKKATTPTETPESSPDA
tara:strand:+ start:694 stop:969 length:276 start_codon:yes stop_codon:yes gene_type:complete